MNLLENLLGVEHRVFLRTQFSMVIVQRKVVSRQFSSQYQLDVAQVGSARLQRSISRFHSLTHASEEIELP